jgi:hypothetical protein
MLYLRIFLLLLIPSLLYSKNVTFLTDEGSDFDHQTITNGEFSQQDSIEIRLTTTLEHEINLQSDINVLGEDNVVTLLESMYHQQSKNDSVETNYNDVMIGIMEWYMNEMRKEKERKIKITVEYFYLLSLFSIVCLLLMLISDYKKWSIGRSIFGILLIISVALVIWNLPLFMEYSDILKVQY